VTTGECFTAASADGMGWVGVIGGQALRGKVCVSETSIDMFGADIELCNLMRARTGAAG
jgi:hypothetical protein